MEIKKLIKQGAVKLTRSNWKPGFCAVVEPDGEHLRYVYADGSAPDVIVAVSELNQDGWCALG